MPRPGWILLGLTVATAGRSARADGGYFPSNVNPASVAETTDQRAVLLYEQGHTTLILQTGYRGSGDDFSWIIPTAALVGAEDVTVVDAPVFDGLHAVTAPMLVSFTQGCGAFGCTGGDEAAGGDSSTAVRVFDGFTAGGYEISVLGADDAQNLVGWLDANGYRTPSNAGPIFADYVSRGFFFLAVRVAQPVGEPDGAPAEELAKPLAIRFAGAVRTFPLVISSLSTARSVDLVLYTIDTRRYAVLNFPTVDMEINDAFTGADFDVWYDERLAAAVADHGGNAFMVEFAAALDGYALAQALGRLPDAAAATDERWFVTRLRARLAPAAMTQDVQLAPLVGAAATAVHRIRVGRAGELAAALPLDTLLIVGLGLALQRRRRRVPARGEG